MGLLENQVETSLVLQEADETLNIVLLKMVEQYAHNPVEGAILYKSLLGIVSTAKSIGRLENIQQNSLKDG